jgi:hypothetical protein
MVYDSRTYIFNYPFLGADCSTIVKSMLCKVDVGHDLSMLYLLNDVLNMSLSARHGEYLGDRVRASISRDDWRSVLSWDDELQ